MHEKSLYQFGKRAVRLLWTNMLDTLTVDMVATFLMTCTCVLLIVTCSTVGMISNHVSLLKSMLPINS